MSQSKWLFPILFVSAIPYTAHAEPQRTALSLENKFPRWEQVEVGATYEAAERDEEFREVDLWAVSPYVRYGLLENLAVRLDVPYVGFDASPGDDESGLGDMVVEFQLRAYEDIFGYPYFIPHVSFSLPTGDEDKGLGADGTVIEGGIAYGDRINDWIGWVLDVGYIVHPDTDDRFRLAHSYTWDLSESFTLLTEIVWEEQVDDDEDSLLLATGGFSYNWTRDLQMGVNVGGGITGDIDIYGKLRLSYSF